ncbi:hypothetical protein PISMIDRAFT_670548 [Pisolithus microcarpus 441]|uniref:Uncharacterized protein n=1 Tax=Pisolithus microcarpus 441 TaxID=765257 RepID=A0A0D0AEK9_9AGAM|nr:hypothetical protein PISMIDRAFT_670548 [Pisolithus microcarpus 441]
MSSIPFPNPSDDLGSSPDALHDSIHSQFYSPPSFDVSGSFQMNPLSAHPPRTPRSSTSITPTSSSHSRPLSAHFGSVNTSVYDEKEEDTQHTRADAVQDHTAGDDGDELAYELDEEDLRVKAADNKVPPREVWRDILSTSYGRDKAFKVMQYSIRVYLLFHTKLLFRNGRSPWQHAMVRRLESARSGFSFTRKMLILFNWLTPLSTILAQKTVPYASLDGSFFSHPIADAPAKKPPSSPFAGQLLSHPFLQALLAAPPPVLLDLVNGLSDDIYTLSRLGLVGQKTGARAARFADWCWFFGTLVGLVQNGIETSIVEGQQREVENRAYQESMSGATSKSQPKASKVDEKELTRLQRKTHWLKLTRTKLVMDLIFVSYDVFRLSRGKDVIQSFTGLVAAILSSLKLYDKYKSALVTKLLSSTV